MLPKSRLLEFLIENANALKQNDGKTAISANYFVISLLQLVAAADRGQLPEELSGDDVKAEIEAARASALLCFSQKGMGPQDALPQLSLRSYPLIRTLLQSRGI